MEVGLTGGETNSQLPFENTTTATAPLAPTKVVAALDATKVTVTWQSAPDATTFAVLRSTQKGTGYQTLVGAALIPKEQTSFDDTTVEAEKTYYYVVTATNPSGTSPYSAEVTAIGPTTPTPAATKAPSAPTGVKATATGTQITVQWQSAGDATTFAIMRGEQAGAEKPLDGANQIPKDKTSYTDAKVEPGKSYFYVMTATNSVGTSPNSEEKSATVPAAGTDAAPAPSTPPPTQPVAPAPAKPKN